MSDLSDSNTVAADVPKGDDAKPRRKPRPPVPVAANRKDQLPVLAALALAVIALAVGILAYFQVWRGPSYSDDERADAKAAVCEAFNLVGRAVSVSTHVEGSAADVVNARLAWVGGGTYLRGRLDQQPATPSDLADAVGSWADKMEVLGFSYLGGSPNSQQLLADANNQSKAVVDLCKD